jgi:serine/threonine protein kinase
VKAAIEQIGPYRVEEKIGTGGMASVFRAVKVGIGGFEHNVAVKVLHPHLADDEEFVSMFHAEARLASRLSHPVLVPVNDLGVVEGTHYMAMDLLLGETLADLYERFRKKGKPFPRGHALYIMERALDGLHYAHELALEDGSPANIVHRDVSPRNIFITTSGAVRVVDFGIARSSGRSRQTRAGIVKGTVPYMAPEQARAQDLDRRADLFAAGVLLHHLLTRAIQRHSDGLWPAKRSPIPVSRISIWRCAPSSRGPWRRGPRIASIQPRICATGWKKRV